MPYGPIVLEHFRRPRNLGTLVRPTVAREGYNPLCGDRVRIELEITDGTIVAAAFTANACAICTASASLLTERLTRATVADALTIGDADMLAALGSRIPDSRVPCATLPLHTVREALGEQRTA